MLRTASTRLAPRTIFVAKPRGAKRRTTRNVFFSLHILNMGEELWNLIQKKQNQMNHHAEICERRLHRYQQQLRQLSEEYNFLMSQQPIQYGGQHLFEEVKNPNRARLDLIAKSAAERERYSEQRDRQRAESLITGPDTTPFNTIFEDQVYEFGKRRRASTAKPLRRPSTEAALRRRSNKRLSKSRSRRSRR